MRWWPSPDASDEDEPAKAGRKRSVNQGCTVPKREALGTRRPKDSEAECSRELQCTAASDAVDSGAAADRAGDLSERSAAIGAVRTVELRGVAELKGVSTELETKALLDREGLEERDIVLNVAGTVIRVAADIADRCAVFDGACACLGTAGRLSKGGGIKPLVSCPNVVKDVVAAHEIRHLLLTRSVDVCAARLDVKRQPGVDGNDSPEFPTADYIGRDTGSCPALAFTEGKFVSETFLKVEAMVIVVGRVVMALIEPEQQASVVACLVAQTFAPGKRSNHAQTVGETAIQLSLQGLVVRGVSHKIDVGCSGAPEGDVFRIAGTTQAERRRKVDVLRRADVNAVVRDVGKLKRELSRQRLLDGDVP